MNKSLGIYNLIDNNGINKSIKNVIDSNIDFNTYATPKGLKELRVEISSFLYSLWNYKANYKDMIITTGSQQSINIITDYLIKEDDVILIEEPTYYGAIDVFKKKKAKLVSFTISELENIIKKYSPKLIYVIPTFNNPTGYSWTSKERKEFLKIINKYNITVLEDDPYSLINFTNNNYKSLYTLNKGKNIIYLGTFSKIISPSINVGYIISNLTDTLYEYKKTSDLCTSLFNQYVVLDYLRNNNLTKVIKEKIIIYKRLLQESINALNDTYKDKIDSYTYPSGGLFYLVKFKDRFNKEEFEEANNYYINGNHSNEARINICSKL